MELKQVLAEGKSKAFAVKLAMTASNDQKLFNELAKLACSNHPGALRASWVLSFACEFAPELLLPIEASLLKNLDQGFHTGITRNLLRIFTVIPVSESNQATMFNEASRIFIDRRFPVAVKANALLICMQLAAKYPDLGNEVWAMAESILPEHGPALNATARKAFKQLKKAKKRKA
ncbi:MAG: hypothetical protein IT240_05095 [Bacteroidia bacterium]|nr:hypothetical protein [Bacteroidia bacterium]MCC6768396.1 hypothetical protein [Bacteroidia bacterium]